jgi:4a-hydroxytetrahydrobiopterin dehydratase
MRKRDLLDSPAIADFLATHPGWSVAGDALCKTYLFTDYPSGVAFTLRVAFAAEKRDHHPDLHLGYRKVEVSWTTHDRGGITTMDTELAELCDQLHVG